MFPHLSNRNFPNMVENQQTKLITIFLLRNLWKKINTVPCIFFVGGGCVLLAVDVKVK